MAANDFNEREAFLNGSIANMHYHNPFEPNWQPIDTVPKLTPVLVYVPVPGEEFAEILKDCGDPRVFGGFAVAELADDSWLTYGESDALDDKAECLTLLGNPTAWMHLHELVKSLPKNSPTFPV